MMRKFNPDAPKEAAELLSKGYARLKPLYAKGSVRGWYKELTRLYKLSVDHNLGLHRAHPTLSSSPKFAGRQSFTLAADSEIPRQRQRARRNHLCPVRALA